MSWTISLYGPDQTEACECPRCGNRHDHVESETLFSLNYTSNINPMIPTAEYHATIGRAYQDGIKASELIAPLTSMVSKMADTPDACRALNPANGWGDYDRLMPLLRALLAACAENPDARVRISS